MDEMDLIARHEGYRKHMYRCTEGYNTIGYGLNLDAGISFDLAKAILEYQVFEVRIRCLQEFEWFFGLNEVRQAVVVNMVFNLGFKGFKKFKQTIYYIDHGKHVQASLEMLDSKWARQVPSRAEELSNMMRTGGWYEK